MVLTCPVRTDNTADSAGGRAGWSRRRVLRGAALLAAATGTAPLAAGCGLFDGGPDRSPAQDALAPLLAGALDLAGRHEAAAAAFPELADRLSPLAQAHRAHAAELARVTGATLPSGSPSPAGPPGDSAAAALAALRTAEQQGRDAAAAACIAAPRARATLVGTVAAARATHLEVLR